MKNVRFVYDEHALPDLTILCLGAVDVGDRLFNTLPTEANAEPSFTIEKISGDVMTLRMGAKRRGTIKFRCLTNAEWNERFG